MHVRVLGPVLLGDRPAPPELTRKPRQILTVLALEAPAALSQERLITLLWDHPPPGARKTLHANVSLARRALATATGVDASLRGGTDYTLAVDGGELDATVEVELRRQARDASARGDHERAAGLLGRARQLWRGEADVPDTLAGAALRAGLAERQRTLVEEHLSALVATGRPADALADIERHLAADPLDERLWALRMRALYRTGRQAEALRAFQEARAALADVGLEVGPELRHLEHEVLTQAPGLDPPPVPIEGPDALVVDLPRYATVDGRRVAYATFGSAPDDLLVLVPGFITIDAYLEEPHLVAALRALATDRRVLALDRTGVGLSDPVGGAGTPTIEHWVADVVAVLDAAGAGAVDVLANADSGLVALTLAATHPERVRRLVLVDPYVRAVASDDYPHGFGAAQADALMGERATPRADAVDHLALVAPSRADDEAFRAWWDRVGRRAASPSTAEALLAAMARADVRAIVDEVAAPTTIVARTRCPVYDPGHATYLAARLASVTTFEVPDTDDLWWLGDLAPVHAALDAAVALGRPTHPGRPGRPAGGRDQPGAPDAAFTPVQKSR